MKKLIPFFLVLFFLPSEAWPLDLTFDGERGSCQEFHLTKKMTVYKDPSLFVGRLGQLIEDPQRGWEDLMSDNPILTTLEGTVLLMKLGSPVEFKNFGLISKFYELVEPRLKLDNGKKTSSHSTQKPSKGPLVVPVRLCSSAYSDSLGFVLVSDFEKALKDDVPPGVLPPSIYPNPIPKLRNP